MELGLESGTLPMSFDQDRYKKALDFAARVHRDQFVPGSGAPYVVHLVKVAMEVMVATEGLVPEKRESKILRSSTSSSDQ